jgi:YbbR domain-containing protein
MIQGMLKNLDMKAVALVLSLLIWLHVVTEKEYTQRIVLPVHYANLPRDLVLVRDPPSKIAVEVVGKGKELARFRFSPSPYAVVDLGGARSGQHRVFLSTANLVMPRGVLVQPTGLLDPSRLDLALDVFASRRVPVDVQVQAEPGGDVVIATRPRAVPGVVAVRGPKSLIAAVEKLKTEPIDVPRTAGAVSQMARVQIPEGESISSEPEYVRVEAEAIKAERRRVEGVRVRVVGVRPGARVSVQPPQISVIVSGVPQVVAGTGPGEVVATVNVGGLPPGTHRLPVSIAPPEGVAVVDVGPRTLTVEIR